VTGCCEQAGTEQCLSVQSSENGIDCTNSLHEIRTGSRPAVCDSRVCDSDKASLSSPLYPAAEAMESSLCLYVCDVCDRRFPTPLTLQRHRRHHKGCAACTDCGRSFYSAAVLRHHSQMQCTRKKVTCNVCRGSFDGWPNLSRHAATTHPTAHVCELCGQAFCHVDQLCAHRTVHATNIHRTCARSLRSQSCVKRHVMKHVPDSHGRRVSEGCLKNLSGDGLILESQFSQDSQDAFISLLSGAPCPSGYILNDVVQDTGISNQQKQATEAAFISEASHLVGGYSQGRRVLALPSPGSTLPPAVGRASDGHTGAERRIGRCLDKQTRAEGEGVAVKAVSPEKVACAVCSRTFKRLSDLHVHMQRHTGEMRYKCAVCGRPFRKSGTLARHMRIHTGERPYICETCGKSYKLLFHLRLHTTVHSSDRPFSCDVCGKAFQTASGLKKHRFVHTGLKPFPCPVCLRLFNRCSNMRAHMRVHQHDVFSHEQVTCVLCRKKFGNAASFQAHLQTHAHQIGLDVGEAITAVESASGFSTTDATYSKQQTEDVYVALPLVHFEDVDVS